MAGTALGMICRVLLGIQALATCAHGHLGFENETEVRIHADRMRVVVRTSFQFAAVVLGERAPAAFDEQGQLQAKPLLKEAAGGLFEFSHGGVVMVPSSTDCVFEPHNQVALILNYAPPREWPLTVRARFFPRLAPLASGTIKVFDETSSPHSREAMPVMTKRISADDPVLDLPSLSGELIPPPPPLPSPAPLKVDESAASPRFGWWLAALVIVLVALAWLRIGSRKRAGG